MTLNPERVAARRARAQRVVKAVGWWTPELVIAALTAALAAWWWPGWWAVTAALLLRIPAAPLWRRWRAHRTTRASGPPRPAAIETTDSTTRDPWEATG